MSNVCQLVTVLSLIVVFQIRSVDDSNDVDEYVDVDEVCIYQVCRCISVFFGCQGLLDEGDSAMEDGEIDSKVSVSVVFCVYCYIG